MNYSHLFDAEINNLKHRGIKKPAIHLICRLLNVFSIEISGERGIRTPGGVTLNGFQDRRIRPLCHLSGANVSAPD
jgi:hypothetical protein